MIFISYNHNDEQLVDMIARRLELEFGRDNIFYDKLSVLRRRASAFLQGAADPRFHAGWRRFPFFGCRTASPRPLSGGLQNVVRGVASIMLRCGASPPWPFPSWRGRSSRASSRCLSAP